MEKNLNGIATAENHMDFDLTELFTKFNLTKRTHKDGTVVYELSSRVVDPDTGAVIDYNDTIWPRNAQIGNEMADAPFRPADMYVRVGWWKNEDGSESRGMKYLEVYADPEHTKAYRPLGDKRPFEGASANDGDATNDGEKGE